MAILASSGVKRKASGQSVLHLLRLDDKTDRAVGDFGVGITVAPS